MSYIFSYIIFKFSHGAAPESWLCNMQALPKSMKLCPSQRSPQLPQPATAEGRSNNFLLGKVSCGSPSRISHPMHLPTIVVVAAWCCSAKPKLPLCFWRGDAATDLDSAQQPRHAVSRESRLASRELLQ